MADLRAQLEDGRRRALPARRHRRRLLDGRLLAPLDQICDLADEFDALVLVDDSHAVGFVGAGGRGTPELFGVMDRVDILTGTLGKALGGASGGYVAAHQEIVDLLRQRSRPYLFSNSVAPPIVAGVAARRSTSLAGSGELRETLRAQHRAASATCMTEAGFDLLPGDAPDRAGDVPATPSWPAGSPSDLLERGVYVIAFSFPVVPRGKARIRVQLSAAHSDDDVAAPSTRSSRPATAVRRRRVAGVPHLELRTGSRPPRRPCSSRCSGLLLRAGRPAASAGTPLVPASSRPGRARARSSWRCSRSGRSPAAWRSPGSTGAFERATTSWRSSSGCRCRPSYRVQHAVAAAPRPDPRR